MTEEPQTNIENEVQNIADGLTGGGNDENEEDKNESENHKEEEDEQADGDRPTNEEEDAEKGELEEVVDGTANNLLPHEEEEEANHEESVAVSEPKTPSETGSRRPRRNKNKSVDQDIDVVIPDLPFAPQPRDPNIIHYIFEYDDGGTKRNTTRNGNNAFSSRSKYQSTAPRGAPPPNGGSLYDNSPYFSKPFTIYKVPYLPRTARPNKTFSSRSRSTERSMNSTQKSNYSNSNSVYESNRSNYMSYSKRYSTRPPPPSNYVERTREFDERQRRYDTEFAERYRIAHPLPLYQPHYQKTVLEMKIEKQRKEERKYRKAAEEAKKRRIKNRKIHEEFIKKTENFENEGEEKPKYLENVSRKHDYLDPDYDLSEEDQNEKQNQSRSQFKQTHNTENQSEKGQLEDQLDNNANALLGNPENKNNEEEEEESHEKLDTEEEDQNDAEKKDEEEEKKEEE